MQVDLAGPCSRYGEFDTWIGLAQYASRCFGEFRVHQREDDLRQAHRRALGGAIKDAIGHAFGAQRFVALLAQNPGNGVDDVGFTAAVRTDDARQARAAERKMGFFKERFVADQFDCTKLEQGIPFI